jgi:hypothetical protein
MPMDSTPFFLALGFFDNKLNGSIITNESIIFAEI